MFQLQVEEEERLAKTKKSSRLMDNEADEEEESGAQAGLGDFGFGTGAAREGELEREALKVRADDFKNIVDELSDE